jgi:hypothetical protein
MYGSGRCNVLSKLTPSLQNLDQEGAGIEEKLEKDYYNMRKRVETRERRHKRGNAKWEYKANGQVLVKTQPTSDTVNEIKSTFMHIYEGPCLISKILDHSAYELKDEWGKLRGEFNKKLLQQYKEEKGDQEGEVERIRTVTKTST